MSGKEMLAFIWLGALFGCVLGMIAGVGEAWIALAILVHAATSEPKP